MRVSMVGVADLSARALAQLGLPQQADGLLSDEALCALLRRSASFLCPATPRQLVDAVLDVVDGMGSSRHLSRDRLNDLVDLLISAGDLLELRDSSQRQVRRLFLAPPSYVVKSPGRYLLLGVRPYGELLLDGALADAMAYKGHTRTISLDPVHGRSILGDVGLAEVSREDWLRAPRKATPAAFLATYRALLGNAGPAGRIEGLTLLDPAAPVRYYQGRRRLPNTSDTGDYVCRRPQAYGADLWCIVRLLHGEPVTMIDLPHEDPLSPGRYEAWRILAALDAERGVPQLVRLRAVNEIAGERLVDVFAPLPGWAERALELSGEPVTPTGGALLSYRMPTDAVDGVTNLLVDRMWMDVMIDGGKQ